MNTLFSHIVQKCLSQEYENIATEAVCFILQGSKAARSGFMKLLRGIAPDLPSLEFRTQESDGETRPDMCGFAGNAVRVFIENKFLAGLTEQQPVSYLDRLGKCHQSSILLFVVPTAREEIVWRELRGRIKDAGRPTVERADVAGGVRSMVVGIGPILALTSWKTLLDAIEDELTDEPGTKHDLLQLRGLCDASDKQCFAPFSAEFITDQRIPSFLLQLSSIVQEAVESAASDGVLSTRNPLAKKPREGNLNPAHSWESIGRYVCFPEASAIGAWLGTEFTLWKDHAATPLWLVFHEGEWGRAREAGLVLEPWANSEDLPAVWRNDGFAIGIKLATGEDKQAVIDGVCKQLKAMAEVLKAVGSKENQSRE